MNSTFSYIFRHQRDRITKEIQLLPAAHSVEHGVSVIDITSLLSHLSLPLVLLVTHPVQNIASDTHGMWWSSTTCACFILTIKNYIRFEGTVYSNQPCQCGVAVAVSIIRGWCDECCVCCSRLSQSRLHVQWCPAPIISIHVTCHWSLLTMIIKFSHMLYYVCHWIPWKAHRETYTSVKNVRVQLILSGHLN